MKGLERLKTISAKQVDNFVTTHKNKLSIYYLPTYSPGLNPQEDVWKYLKHVKLKAHQAKTVKELSPLVHNKLKSIQPKKSSFQLFFMPLVYTN